MAMTIDQLVQQELGRQAWIILQLRAQLEQMQAELAKVKAEKAPLPVEPS